jgi:hypothetical protein
VAARLWLAWAWLTVLAGQSQEIKHALDVRLRMRPGGFFFFGSPCTLRDFIAVTSSSRFDVTSSLPLRLHVDRGLVRHGYPWVPTDQGPRGPVKWTRPARRSADLQVGLETSSAALVTLEDL